jgi:hypothetical protein
MLLLLLRRRRRRLHPGRFCHLQTSKEEGKQTSRQATCKEHLQVNQQPVQACRRPLA